MRARLLLKTTRHFVHCTVEVDLADGDVGVGVFGTCSVRQSAQCACGQAQQGARRAGRWA